MRHLEICYVIFLRNVSRKTWSLGTIFSAFHISKIQFSYSSGIKIRVISMFCNQYIECMRSGKDLLEKMFPHVKYFLEIFAGERKGSIKHIGVPEDWRLKTEDWRLKAQKHNPCIQLSHNFFLQSGPAE